MERGVSRRVEKLLPLFAPEKLQAKIDAGANRIRPVAQAIGEDFAKSWGEAARGFRERASERQEGILHPRAPQPLEFKEQGWALIEGWEPRNEEDAKLEEQEHDGRACLLIEVGASNRCTASFRAGVLLTKGKYRLEALVKTIGVVPLADEKGPGGAGVRISAPLRENQASGSADWQTISHTFEIAEESGTVELVLELRATSGSALFELPSLHVVKLD